MLRAIPPPPPRMLWASVFCVCLYKNRILEILGRPTQGYTSLSTTPFFFSFLSEEIGYPKSDRLSEAKATTPQPLPSYPLLPGVDLPFSTPAP